MDKKKGIRISICFFMVVTSSFSLFGLSVAITDDEANESIRDTLTTGVYTSNNLNVGFGSIGDQWTVTEKGIQIGNLVEFDVGSNNVINGTAVDRVAFMTFRVSGNAATKYNWENAMNSYSESNKEIRYMKIAAYDENWLGDNSNPESLFYDIEYHDYDFSVKSELGYDGSLPITVDFDTSDFDSDLETTMSDGTIFATTGILSSIESVNVVDRTFSYVDSGENIYQLSDPSQLSVNKVSDLASDDYSEDEEAPYAYRSLSYKVEGAGLTGISSTKFLTTSGATGHRSEMYCQGGQLSKVGDSYRMGLQLEPEVKVKQESIQYKKITSARSDYISLDREIGEDTGEYAAASLSTLLFTRELGVELYNVNVHFELDIVVKLILSTEIKIQTTDITDSNVGDTINYEQGDMFWDNALDQETGEFLLDSSPAGLFEIIGQWFEDLFGFDLSWLLYVGVILVMGFVAIKFVLPVGTAVVVKKIQS